MVFCARCGQLIRTTTPTAHTNPARAGQARVSDETIINAFSNVRVLLSRLRSRSRTEIFYPGSLAPELLRRAEEILEEIASLEMPTALRDERTETARLRADLAAANARADEAERERNERAEFMRGRGYRRCDIAACNCNSWHGGHADRRLSEIRDVLDGEGGFNGVTTLEAVTRLFARIAELEKAGTREQGLREAAGIARAEAGKLLWHLPATQVGWVSDAITRAILAALDTPTEGGEG